MGHRRAHAFAAHHERLVEAMARFLAIALENADRFHERDRVAAALQETLLPPLLPFVSGVDLAARYRATTPEVSVGGDFYDVFRVGDRWAAVIGDVCGTGPEAAAVTGIARYTVRALAGSTSSPGATLLALNDALLQQRSERRFLTALHLLFSVVDTASTSTSPAAGHPPPVLLRADGSASLLDEPKGMLLGVFDDADVDDGTVHLDPGDSLVLFTDGVVEARLGRPRSSTATSACSTSCRRAPAAPPTASPAASSSPSPTSAAATSTTTPPSSSCARRSPQPPFSSVSGADSSPWHSRMGYEVDQSSGLASVKCSTTSPSTPSTRTRPRVRGGSSAL